jgi:hypothetical protein
MASTKTRSWSLTVTVVLVIVQGILGFLRAIRWFESGVDLLGEGVVFVPLLGLVAIGRGTLIAGIAVLYVLFAIGSFAGKDWAWWVGLVAALVNGALVVSALLQGESVVQSLVWLIVPVILLVYLFIPQKRAVLTSNY